MQRSRTSFLDWKFCGEDSRLRLSSDIDTKPYDIREPERNPLSIEPGPVLVRVPESGSQELIPQRTADIGNLARGGNPFLVRVAKASGSHVLLLRRALIGAVTVGTFAVVAFFVHSGPFFSGAGRPRIPASNDSKCTQNGDHGVNKFAELTFPLRTENPGLQPLAAGPRSNSILNPGAGQTPGELAATGMRGSSGTIAVDLTAPGVSLPTIGSSEAPPPTLTNFVPQDEGASLRARQLSVALVNGARAREAEALEESAWQGVSSTDQDSLNAYLKNFPSGKHAAQAQHLLANITAYARDAQAVLSALERYSKAWSSKDIADITALRPGLAPRAIKQQLSSVRSIAMHIRPVSSPKIEGDRAAVDCIHEVDETFSDGVEKSKPGVRMTYALVRNGGDWLIQDSH